MYELPKLTAEPSGVYYTLRAYVMFIRRTGSLYYVACPDNNHKMVELAPGRWRCEKDDKEYDTANYRYILSLNVADSTGAEWMSAFDDVSQMLLGAPARDIAGLTAEDPMVAELLNKASMRQYVFRVRIKQEEYLGVTRTKHQILRAAPVDFTEESKLLLQEIRSYHAK